MEAAPNPVRPAAVAGTWYPADPAALAAEVDGYLAAAGPVHGFEATALIAPHAGLVYSGPVAAHAYAAVRGRTYDAAVLVGPSHHVAFDGVSVYGRGAWATPLGPAVVDAALAARLAAASPLVSEYPRAHRREHSLELQLPFLRRLLPATPIVPLVMGCQRRETVLGLADALADALRGAAVLLVASTDLSHYFDAEEAAELDARVVAHVARFDWAGLLDEFERYPEHERGRCVACGGGAAIAVMRAARALGATAARVLERADSGHVSGDREQVVGYLAAAFGASIKRGCAPNPRPSRGTMLAPQARARLLRIARAALGGAPGPDAGPPADDPAAAGGAFVTLRLDGRLRGCVGRVGSERPLDETVRDVARAAAAEDPRFPALRPAELARLVVEVSVLGALEPCPGPDALIVGRHGVLVEQGPRRGLLLPQVAAEQGWDASTLVAQTCVKAGLEPDAWRRGAALFRFEAEVFAEDGPRS